MSGLVPILNIEFYLIAMGALTTAAAMPILLMATLGQMAAKVLLYLAGQGVVSFSGRYKDKLESYRSTFERWKGKTDLLVFTSAATGLPPFLVISPLAGAFRMGLVRFFIWGSIGRFVRFAAVFFAPRLVREYWG